MLPLLGGLITGGASLLGNIFSSDTSAQNTQANIAAQEQMQQQTQTFNAQQAQLNRDFQQQQSSTAYQRSTQDMLKAGLNPAMMFGSGGPAPVGSGSTASVGTPNMALSQKTSPFAGLGDAVSKAINSAVQAKTIDEASSRIASQELQREIDAKAAPLQRGLTTEHIGLTEAETRKIRALQPLYSLTGTTAQDVMSGVNPAVRKSLNIGAWGGEKVGDTLKPVEDLANTLTSSALRKRGLDLLEQKQKATDYSTEHYDVRPGGYTRSKESWSN